MGNRAEHTSTREQILFCLGLGLSDAWWLCSSTVAVAPNPSSGEAWTMSLILHGASLAVQLVCFLLACYLGPRLVARFFALAVGSAMTVFSVAAAIAMFGLNQWIAARILLACAAAANALLFLGWMRRFTSLFTACAPLSLVLASMACGAVVWGAMSFLAPQSAVIIASAFPLVSAILLGRKPVLSGELQAPANPSAQKTSLVKLLPPLFLAGIFIYELAPGMVTSLAHINGMAEVYRWYALGMVAVAALSFIPGKNVRFSNIAFRLVVPLISLGLIVFALVSLQESAVAMSVSLLGSMLFEAFLFVRFAQISLNTSEEPVRVFAFGGFVMQLGILAAYILIPVLAASVQVTIASLALAVVFLLVLTGAFFGNGLQEEQSQTAGVQNAVSSSSEEPFRPAGERFHEECDAFASTYNLSRRESQVFELAMQGKNQAVIAKELFVAETTVKTHLRGIYRKTNTANRQELIALFLERRA